VFVVHRPCRPIERGGDLGAADCTENSESCFGLVLGQTRDSVTGNGQWNGIFYVVTGQYDRPNITLDLTDDEPGGVTTQYTGKLLSATVMQLAPPGDPPGTFTFTKK